MKDEEGTREEKMSPRFFVTWAMLLRFGVFLVCLRVPVHGGLDGTSVVEETAAAAAAGPRGPLLWAGRV